MTDLTPLALILCRHHAAGGWHAVAREVERMIDVAKHTKYEAALDAAVKEDAR